jgi:rhamnosyl/mannosyltransferase
MESQPWRYHRSSEPWVPNVGVNPLAAYPEKTIVIPIGLDKASYPEPRQERLMYWREKLDPKFFLIIGVRRHYKGLHILMEAAQGTDYPIVILGSGPIEGKLKG